jgi:hypothetical protein
MSRRVMYLFMTVVLEKEIARNEAPEGIERGS